MLAILLALFAAPAEPVNPPPPPKTVSPLVVSPTPSTQIAAHPDATITSAGADDGIGAGTAIWPREAYGVGTGGRVTLSCRVNSFGLAEACRVMAEQPPRLGFGDAALAMRPTFKLAPPQGLIGSATRVMTINVNFRAPNTEIDPSGFAQASAANRMGGAGPPVSGGLRGNRLKMTPVVMVNNPVWISAANFDDLAKAYPATGGGTEGYAAAHCKVERSGRDAGALHGCQVMKELPRGHGFGRAALTLMPKFRVRPEVLEHAPRDAPLWVDVPVRLPPPDKLGDRTVMAPVWLTRFDPAAIPRVFPPEAVAKGLDAGQGIARCTVTADGGLAGCVPEAAAPDGLGFSEAAVKLASAMRMNLWSADGAPVEGGVVRIPIRLNLRPAAD